MLIQVIQHHARHSIAFQRDHNAHTHTIGGFILNLGNANKLALIHLLRDVGNHVIGVDLVRKFRNHNGLAVAFLFNGGHTAHTN